MNKNKKFIEDFYIDDFIEDLSLNRDIPILSYPEEYDGQEHIKLACTQHTNNRSVFSPMTPYKQKKITQEWADFLSLNKLSLKSVQFCTKTNQQIFDAICTQDSITSLRFKWCCVPNISNIAKLKNLKKLFIGLGTSITDISAVGELPELEVLRIGNTAKVSDYSALGKLKKLKVLYICGGDTLNPVTITMKSDSFIGELDSLQYLALGDVKFIEKIF